MDEIPVKQPIGSILFEINGNRLEISGPIDWVKAQCTDLLNKIIVERKVEIGNSKSKKSVKKERT